MIEFTHLRFTQSRLTKLRRLIKMPQIRTKTAQKPIEKVQPTVYPTLGKQSAEVACEGLIFTPYLRLFC